MKKYKANYNNKEVMVFVKGSEIFKSFDGLKWSKIKVGGSVMAWLYDHDAIESDFECAPE